MNDYEIETAEYLEHGLNLFQCALFGSSEDEHIQRYNEYFKPRGFVIDMGAGIGTMCAGLKAVTPEITRTLNITSSPTQVAIMRELGRECLLSDYHHIDELSDEVADYVMFNEAFGYGDPTALMQESARLLAPGGRLVVKDFAANRFFTEDILLGGWEYRVYTTQKIITAAANAGLRCDFFVRPIVYMQHWWDFMYKSRMPKWHGQESFDVEAAVFAFTKGADRV
jgi:SAM-dependent methyltransferase